MRARGMGGINVCVCVCVCVCVRVCSVGTASGGAGEEQGKCGCAGGTFAQNVFAMTINDGTTGSPLQPLVAVGHG